MYICFLSSSLPRDARVKVRGGKVNKMATLIVFLLTLGIVGVKSALIDDVVCGPTDAACECNAEATVCKFRFYVELLHTFMRFNTSLPQGQGERVYIDSVTGEITPYDLIKCPQAYNCLLKDTRVECVNKNIMCTSPIIVDGKTYKRVITVNKQFPGPTLIVHEGQIVAVDVHNNLSTEGISIHWHGQHQIKTNFMDGVGLVTQCPIQPGSSFRYVFKANPSGTFWYHSHMGSQRTNGLFGALIVKEKELNYPIPFIDNPASHTVTLIDWFQTDFDDFVSEEMSAVHLHPDLPPYTIPSNVNPSKPYRETPSPDFTTIGNLQFWSGLINGKGKHSSIPYQRSILKAYQVEQGERYRFRLIHTGTMYPFKFSVDNHKLKVMATDGYLVQPVEVDYIALHSGERYDFLLEATEENGNYWVTAETFEINKTATGPPYDFLDHKAEAILHYTGAEQPGPLQYGNITRHPKQCTLDNPCTMLNCPFENFHPSYNIECMSIDNLRLVQPTPESDMPDIVPDITYFMNMGGWVSSYKPISTINDKKFVFPSYPLTTFSEKNDESSFCGVHSECNDSVVGCKCTTVLDIGDNVTVRLVISTVGEERNSTHSMHIHGHSVHVLKVGYGEYSSENGSLLGSSRDLTCTKDGDDADILDHIRCPNPRFRYPNMSFPLDPFTVRKDTFILPPGGYVVVQFRSDNPGYWFFHCHVELHQREGMVLIIREAVDKVVTAPSEMKTCGPFKMDIAKILTSDESGSGVVVKVNLVLQLMVSAVAILQVIY